MSRSILPRHVFIEFTGFIYWYSRPVWYEEGTPRDVTGWTITLPDEEGTVVPQLVDDEHYKYLGTEMPTSWRTGKTHGVVRAKVTKQCIRDRVVKDIGSLELPPETLKSAMDLGVAGIIGAYGRGSVITYEDCVTIETAKTEVLKAQHIAVAIPRAVAYNTAHGGGIEMSHAYAFAGGALIDQIDRALSSPTHHADHTG